MLGTDQCRGLQQYKKSIRRIYCFMISFIIHVYTEHTSSNINQMMNHKNSNMTPDTLYWISCSISVQLGTDFWYLHRIGYSCVLSLMSPPGSLIKPSSSIFRAEIKDTSKPPQDGRLDWFPGHARFPTKEWSNTSYGSHLMWLEEGKAKGQVMTEQGKCSLTQDFSLIQSSVGTQDAQVGS